MPRDVVVATLGKPNRRSSFQNKEVLYYERGKIELTDGKVSLISLAILAEQVAPQPNPSTGSTVAQELVPNFTSSFLRKTQKYSSHKDGLTLVWWIPVEFWKSFMAQKYPRMTEAQINEHTKFLSPYLIFLVADAKLDEFGDVHSSSTEFVRANIKAKDTQNNMHLPLNEDDIDTDTKYFLQKGRLYCFCLIIMKSPGWENVDFVLFPSRNKDGLLIADTKKQGSVSVIIEDRQIQWDLPLDTRLSSPFSSPAERPDPFVREVMMARQSQLQFEEKAFQDGMINNAIAAKRSSPADLRESVRWNNPATMRYLHDTGQKEITKNKLSDRSDKVPYGWVTNVLPSRTDIDRWAIPAWQEYKNDTFLTRANEFPDLKK